MNNVIDDDDEHQVSKFAAYGLSPPPLFCSDRFANFEQTLKRIKADFKYTWRNGTEEEKKILLFLYSRGYFLKRSKEERTTEIALMLQDGEGCKDPDEDREIGQAIRQQILQVLHADGDQELSSTKWEIIYSQFCVTCHRYFRQRGAVGFKDMSNVNYYLRNQEFGNCFIQAPCLLISYLMQFFKTYDFPPIDACKFIRHYFRDEQLKRFIAEDEGGDSSVILKILDKNLFDCDDRSFIVYPSNTLDDACSLAQIYITKYGPALVSKFRVSRAFKDSSEVRKQHKRETGYIRFTTWGEQGEFIPLDPPADESQREEERALMDRCRTFFADNSKSRETVVVSKKSSSDSISNEAKDEAQNISEKVDDPVEYELHAMILLGYRVDEKTGETYWVLQNSWTGMPLIEVSTEYFMRSAATITFLSKGRTPKAKAHMPVSLETCPSPVAECSQLERSDCEDWSDSLLFGEDN
jgi:hypothetical protein